MVRLLIKNFNKKKKSNIIFSKLKIQIFQLLILIQLPIIIAIAKFIKTRVIIFVSNITRKVIIQRNILNLDKTIILQRTKNFE